MDHGILEAARVIRPNLTELVGPAAEELDARIAELLAADAAGKDVTVELRSLFANDDATQSFLDAVLGDAPHYRPPSILPSDLRGPGFTQLAGDVAAPHANRYVCPLGDYVWYRLLVGATVPLCGTHQITLVQG